MLRTRTLRFLLAAVLVAAGSWAVRAATTPPAPAARTQLDIPGDTPSGLSATQRLAFWAGRVEEQPTDFLSLTQLALAHAEHARRTFDLGGFDRAAEAVEQALAISPENPATIRVRASVRFALHEFGPAVADAERVLARLPDDPAALAILGDAQLELGRVDAARATFDRLAGVAGGSALDVRRARLAWVTGDLDAAARLARAALAAAPDEPPERAFYAYAAGEYARLAGDAAAARNGFELALSLDPDGLPALTGLARIEAWEGDRRAARELLDRAAAVAPQPETLALTADLRRLDGDEAGARRAEATIGHIAELAGPSATVWDRQLLLWELDHGGSPAQLLRSAERALEARPDAAGHDLLAWAAYHAGDHERARAENRAALATGLRDARALYHAGAIALATGDTVEGRRHLEAALALGPALDPAETAAARALLEDAPPG